MKKKIACLPIAGIKNPYQYLMIEGLNKSNYIVAFNGVDDRFFGILRTYFKHKPDYIHFDWITSYYHRRKFWMTLLLLPGFILQIYYIKFFTNTRLVWTLHNILPHNADHINFHIQVRKWFASQCDWIRVFSESSIQKANRTFNLPEQKLKVVPEGDYTSFYQNNTDEYESRKFLGLSADKKVLLYLGLIKPYKGLEKLIDTFHTIEETNLILIIAGAPIDVAYSTFLKNKISEYRSTNIIYRDEFIPESELQYYFNASDFVVLPFDKIENSGSVIMAMGFKKAIIAPQAGVVVKRLAQQQELLFTDLKATLLMALALPEEEVQNIGMRNYNQIQQYKWEHFSELFI